MGLFGTGLDNGVAEGESFTYADIIERFSTSTNLKWNEIRKDLY